MTDLSQSVADYLLAVEKVAANAKYRVYPGIGGRVEVPLKSLDGHEAFLLNINRGRVLQAKVTYQTRAVGHRVCAAGFWGGASQPRWCDCRIAAS